MYKILIPARYSSQRFPGKPLANLMGKPLIEHVWRNCCGNNREVYVVTDHPEIESVVKSLGGMVLRVDDNTTSGTDRIFLAVQRNFPDFDGPIVNVQGDEPLLKGQDIDDLAYFFKKSSFDVTTFVHERQEDWEDFESPHVVKSIYTPETKTCHYFSRTGVPYMRNNRVSWFHHTGVYVYNAQSLNEFYKTPPSRYESVEGLEQLRFLEMGKKIGALTLNKPLIGVDTPEDLARVEGVLSGQ